MNALQWPHLLLILAVILLLFGAAKLPALAKSVGQSARVFKKEVKAMREEDDVAPAANTAAPDPLTQVTSTEPSAPDTPRSS